MKIIFTYRTRFVLTVLLFGNINTHMQKKKPPTVGCFCFPLSHFSCISQTKTPVTPALQHYNHHILVTSPQHEPPSLPPYHSPTTTYLLRSLLNHMSLLYNKRWLMAAKKTCDDPKDRRVLVRTLGYNKKQWGSKTGAPPLFFPTQGTSRQSFLH